MRTLENMNSTGSSEIQRTVAAALARRPYSHRQDVDPAIAAIITVEEDRRFLPDTLQAVLEQTVLPCTIVIADCSGETHEAATARFEVIPSPAGPLRAMPQTKGVDVRIVPVEGAASFFDAARRGAAAAMLPDTVGAWWLLHDDSRPLGEDTLAHLAESWRNNPTASLLGCKQLDWDGGRLHDVGLYAGHHRVESLVVDGEDDQEQYDSRQDVFAVSLAGALMPLKTLDATGGTDRWFTTFGESADLCRRICLSGGRVVVVPQAGIGHRRARFEGLRTRTGREVDEDDRLNPAFAIRRTAERYRYTDTRMLLWPLLWLYSLVCSLAQALTQLTSKRPYEAGVALCLPWTALAAMPGAAKARRRVAEQTVVPLSRLSALMTSRRQIAAWKERTRALEDQRRVVLLGPLAKAHLHRRLMRRWGLALAAAAIAMAAVLAAYHDLLPGVMTGGSLYSDALVPTDATLRQLADAATTPWVFGSGTGAPAPPAPWLLVWLAASVVTLGHPAAALSLVFLAAAPAAVLAFWALAGVFTRSDAVRAAGGLLWAATGAAMGLFSSANLPMLTVMVFLPAAFAFVFRAVGMYRAEDQVPVHRSVQCAALASLCFVPVVAAEPQLLLPLMAVFLLFLLFVRRHRVMLLLMPVPAAFAVAPTLANAVRYAGEGAWRQLFADMMLPTHALNGDVRSGTLIDALAFAFGVDGWSWTAAALAASGCLTAALAVLSLLLPFALRVSRMMWMTVLAGAMLAVCCPRIAVDVDMDGPMAASVLPGVAFMLLGMLSCACIVAGGAVRRFEPLRRPGDAPAPDAKPGRVVAARTGRIALSLLLAASALACTQAGVLRSDAGGVRVGGSGLPMVAADYLAQGADHRVLALHADGENAVGYTVMRTRRGDLVDESPALRIREAVLGAGDADEVIADAAARLLAGADADAVASISALGFGGVFVAVDDDDAADGPAQRLMTNVAASQGVRAVVAADNGTYYRLTINSVDAQNIDISWQRRTQSSPWRTVWIATLAVLLALYCLVALPHRAYRYHGEES